MPYSGTCFPLYVCYSQNETSYIQVIDDREEVERLSSLPPPGRGRFIPRGNARGNFEQRGPRYEYVVRSLYFFIIFCTQQNAFLCLVAVTIAEAVAVIIAAVGAASEGADAVT